MKGWPSWDRSHISKLASKYDTAPIRRAKFLLALKEAAIQYVESEKNNAADEDDDIVKSRDGDLRRMNSMDAFLNRMNSTIIQWRTYLASLNGDTLVLSNAKVDEFVAMVEHARVFVGVVLQCLERDFKYTTANILHVDASIVGMLWPM
jgi:hypothetical protein